MNSYLKTFLYLSIAVFMATGLISYVLDPFGMFRSYGLRTDYLLGERIWEDQRKVKDLSLDRLRPDTLIVGNSRVLKGFDVYDPRLEQQLGIAHNLGLSGANLDELDHYTRFAMRAQPLRTLIIGLDIGQFTEARSQGKSEAAKNSYLHELYIADMVNRFSYALWSPQAIEAWGSVIRQPHTLTMRGTPNYDQDSKALLTMGPRKATLMAEHHVANRLRTIDSDLYVHRMRLMDALIADACMQGTVVKLFISPVHARHLVLLQEVGLTDKSFQWKQALIEIVGRHHASGCDVVLLDFGRITTYTSEPFPDLDNHAYSMKWYWDSGHYKPALGFLVLQRLLNHTDLTEEFGLTLMSASADQSFKAERAELHQYINEHPDVVSEIRQAIRPDKQAIQ
jgi:hypothetical protein